MSLSIKLSTRYFAEASKITGNEEFRFIIGDEKISCHKFVAAFISPSITQNLLSDPTIESFHINLGNQKNDEDKKQKEEKIQKYIHQLIIGDDIEISEEEIQKFISELDNINTNSQLSDLPPTDMSTLLLLNQSLKNDEINDKIYRLLFSFLISNTNEENKNAENRTKEEITQKIVQIQKVEKFLKLIENQDSNSFIEYANKYLEKEYNVIIDEIASHFDEIDEKYFFDMNEILLNSILSSQKLKIENEDSLLSVLLNRRKYILSNQSNDDNQHQFYIEKIEFEYLSEDGIKNFLNEIEFDEISFDVWSQIKKRLILPVQIKTNNNQRHKNQPKSVTYKYNSSNPFCGILDHLSKVSNGNIQKNNTVEITCSNLSCGQYYDIVDFQNEIGHTHVAGNPSPRWLRIDFRTRKIQIDSYMIKSGHTNEEVDNKYYLKSWKVEISSDGNKWDSVDERTNVSELNGNYKMHVFNLNKITDPFRFIRIITDQGNWTDDSHGFSIGKIELYGNIVEST